MSPFAFGADLQKERERARRHGLDLGLIAATMVLLLVGLMALYSVGYQRTDSRFGRQVLNLLVGMVPFSIFAFVRPHTWRKAAHTLYGLNLVFLVAVLLVGTNVNGARRWIELGPLQFQPSEMAKLFTVLTLSAFFASRADEIRKPSTFALSFLHVLVPLLLVFKQPHLGATLVILFTWLAISLYAGVPLRYLGGSVLAVSLVLVGGYFVPGILKDYQKERIKALFVHDVEGSDYQTSRAEIAYGVGSVMGTGYLKGQQKQSGFIPEQDTDFIFSVVGEEGGLIGCTLVLAAFGLFFYRVWLIGFQAVEPFNKMVVGGILALIGFHMTVNLFMNLQMGPVVGLWLPFLSYGGTALWLCLSCVGLLLSIRMREKPLEF
ncbi:MAG: rod shape-determining protein RodA [Fimbriimonadaceae bacterium]|nr:rod shape-determining protein RodA [Fimbriimonadaceae bacterium]